MQCKVYFTAFFIAKNLVSGSFFGQLKLANAIAHCYNKRIEKAKRGMVNMLQLILGKAGTGKTDIIMKMAKEVAKNGEAIIIVPDQICFYLEQRIVSDCSPEIAANIKALSFNRLCDTVFRTYGGISEERINDKGKSVLMALALEDCADSLELYADAVKSGKMLSLMLDIADEFKSCKLGSDELFWLCEQMGAQYLQVRKKLYEIALVYASFEARLESVYIEPTDMATRAGEILREEEFFKGKVLFLDSFESFNKQKLDIISTALIQCKEVYCTLCTDEIYPEEDDTGSIFSTIQKTGRALMAMAKESSVRIKSYLKLGDAFRFKSEDIYNFSECFTDNYVQKHHSAEHISVYKATDIYSELEYVGATIRELVIKGYNYSDIGIICRNSEKYSHVLSSVLKRYEVPAYISRPIAAGGSPLIRLVSAVFKIAIYGYQTQVVLNLAKSGLCGISTQEVSELENYVYLWKIDKGDWRKEFTKPTGGFSGENNEAQLLKIEEYRRKIVEPIESFIKKTKDCTAKAMCKSIYELLVDYACEDCVIQSTQLLEEALLFEEAAEQIRVWEELMDSLDQFASVLADKKISVKQFWLLFGEVISKQEIMDIPLRLDCVSFGSAENIKTQCKVIFLIGCVQDEFPKMPTISGVFTSGERKQLSDNSLMLEKNIEDDMLLERFFAYASVASATELLYISYPSTQNATDLAPSEIVNKAVDVMGVKPITYLEPTYFANSYGSLFSTAAKTYRDKDEQASAIRECVKTNSALVDKFLALQRSVGDRDFSIDNKDISSKLFSFTRLSPSGIDVYHRCKFRYYCQYGLYARERNVAEVNVLEYGTIMHYIFEQFLKDEKGIENYSDEEFEARISELVYHYAKENMGGFDHLYVRDKYRLNRISRTAKIIVKRLAAELRQSKFVPKYLEPELKVGGEFPPLKIEGENGNIYVGGKIDRVDIYEGRDGSYVRVVDYKTGTKQFKLSDVLMGMNLQMLIYLYALAQTGLLPAGVLYMPSAYPEVTGQKGESDEKLYEMQAKKMCMNGLVLNNNEIITAMEQAVQGKYIPIKQNKNGDFTGESLIEKGDLNTVFSYIKTLINTMAKELTQGNIEAKPLMKNMNSCSICPYISVCLNEGAQEVKTEKVDAILEMEKSEKRGEENA